MKKTISENDFLQAFSDMDRKDQFTYYALTKIFEYYEECEFDSGEEIELDVIAICCDLVEYDSLESLQEDYSDIEDQDDLECVTQVICYEDDCIIIAAF